MKRSSLSVRIGRVVQKLPLWLFQCIEGPLTIYYGDRRKKPQLIFILALPRSGSTVAYQTICHGLKVQYLSNIWNLFYQLPFMGGKLSRGKALRHQSDFRSRHGFVSGIDGPAEGLRFWKWWMDCGLHDTDSFQLSSRTRRRRFGYIRKVLGALTSKHEPFVTAYLGHSLMPDQLVTLFPEAVVIRLRRNPIDNALSLLTAMRESGSQWFSVVPNECLDSVNLTEHQRVAAQVYWLNRRLDDSACSGEFLEIRYENLCDDPRKEIARVDQFCRQRGLYTEHKFQLPRAFAYRRADLECDKDAAAIIDALTELENKHGALA